MKRRPSRRSAFTLIELLASAVLAALMMAALLNVVWSALRESKVYQQTATSHFPTTHLVDQMRSDFLNARGMAWDDRGVTLHGFLGRDPRTAAPLLVPGRVRYEVRPIGQHSVLVRSSHDGTAEPVWIGFSKLLVESLAEPDTDEERIPEPETGGLPDVPLTFRVTAIGDQGQLLWREVIHHHAQ